MGGGDLTRAGLDVTLIERFCLPHTTSTILHDWLKGRRSEVDDINGLVVAERELTARAPRLYDSAAALSSQKRSTSCRS